MFYLATADKTELISVDGRRVRRGSGHDAMTFNTADDAYHSPFNNADDLQVRRHPS